MPLETFSRTFDSCGTFVPAGGASAGTVPFGCVEGAWTGRGTSFAPRIVATAAERLCPTTFGVRTSRPGTRIPSGEPRAADAPAAGRCGGTGPVRPRGATVAVWTTSPRPRNSPTATAAFFPTTFGTTTCCAVETASVTMESFVTCAPADGSSPKTVPAGSLLVLLEIRAA